MNFDRLFAAAAPLPAAPVQGYWQAIRFQPDPTTGEQFNIGVVFFEKWKKTPHARIIPSLIGFKALYGSSGAENFNFLLSLLREQMVIDRTAISPSPQITFSEKKYASGNNPSEIVDRIFSSVVTLSFVQEHEPTADKQKIVGTADAKNHVVRFLNKALEKSKAHQFIKNSPVTITDGDKRKHKLDLPIWNDDLFAGRRYAAVISMQYADEHYRGHFINLGYRHLQLAWQYSMDNNPGAFFILRPSRSQGFVQSQINTVDNEIDDVCWWLAKQKFNIEVADTQESLARKTLQYLGG